VNGRGRGRPQKRSDCAVWLKAFLSGGHRMADDIVLRGAEQGFGSKTVKRAKAGLGFVSFRKGTEWAWRNPAVIERDLPDPKASLEDKLLHKIDEFARLAQAPKASTSAEVPAGEGHWSPGVITEEPDVNQVDQYGFHMASPLALGLIQGKATIQPAQILQRIRQLDQEGSDQKENANKVFEWAYPSCGLSESILAQMLRNQYMHVSRADVRMPNSNATS